NHRPCCCGHNGDFYLDHNNRNCGANRNGCTGHLNAVGHVNRDPDRCTVPNRGRNRNGFAVTCKAGSG
ncbi:unnamed protein product, partial [Rotaria sordida]